MYGIGFIIGYLIYLGINQGKGDRLSWLPGNQIMNQLNHKELIYSAHAIKQMNCRTISKAEINALLKTGEVNFGKSKTRDLEKGHCPSYAVEGNTKDGQQIRVVFANCEKTAKVITAIDLENEYACE